MRILSKEKLPHFFSSSTLNPSELRAPHFNFGFLDSDCWISPSPPPSPAGGEGEYRAGYSRGKAFDRFHIGPIDPSVPENSGHRRKGTKINGKKMGCKDRVGQGRQTSKNFQNFLKRALKNYFMLSWLHRFEKWWRRFFFIFQSISKSV